jgi:hypothetical protein
MPLKKHSKSCPFVHDFAVVHIRLWNRPTLEAVLHQGHAIDVVLPGWFSCNSCYIDSTSRVRCRDPNGSDREGLRRLGVNQRKFPNPRKKADSRPANGKLFWSLSYSKGMEGQPAASNFRETVVGEEFGRPEDLASFKGLTPRTDDNKSPVCTRDGVGTASLDAFDPWTH